MINGRGGVAIELALAAHVAPLESRNTSRDSAALYTPGLNSSAHIFSDSISCLLLLFVLFFATVTTSNLAIAIAATFRKSLVALPSTRPIR